MADIIIKKKVELGFLGEDYKDSYITFRSISVSDYQGLTDGIEDMSEQEASKKIISILETYFVEGLFDGQKLAKEDIKKFDGETILKCFETLTGQKTVEGERQLDPKSETESTSTSTTEVVTAEK